MLDLGLALVAVRDLCVQMSPLAPGFSCWVCGMGYGVQAQVFLLERSRNPHLMAVRYYSQWSESSVSSIVNPMTTQNSFLYLFPHTTNFTRDVNDAVLEIFKHRCKFPHLILGTLS